MPYPLHIWCRQPAELYSETDTVQVLPQAACRGDLLQHTLGSQRFANKQVCFIPQGGAAVHTELEGVFPTRCLKFICYEGSSSPMASSAEAGIKMVGTISGIMLASLATSMVLRYRRLACKHLI